MKTATRMIRETERAEREVEDYIQLCQALNDPRILAYLKKLHDSTFDGNIRVELAGILKHIKVHSEA